MVNGYHGAAGYDSNSFVDVGNLQFNGLNAWDGLALDSTDPSLNTGNASVVVSDLLPSLGGDFRRDGEGITDVDFEMMEFFPVTGEGLQFD